MIEGSNPSGGANFGGCMNGKVAKFLRKINKDDKKSKRGWFKLSKKQRGQIRKAYNESKTS